MNEIQLLQQLAGIAAASASNLPNDPTALKKALTTSSGFLGYNLESKAKWMQPFFAGLRRRIPSKQPKMGAAAATWRMQLGNGGFNFGANMGTPNGGVGAATTESATSISAAYASQSINGGVQFEAISQAMGWDDAMNLDTTNALSLLMRIEEYACLFGNRDAITMSTPTMVASTPHVGPTFANGTWHIRVTAITGQGSLTNASANSNTGESAVASALVASGASGCDFFDVVWAAVPGAVGYKVYIETSAASGVYQLLDPNQSLAYAKADANNAYNTTAGDAIVVGSGNNTQTYVTVTRVQVKALTFYTGNPIPPVADGSANLNMFEGILAWCQKSTIYSQALSSAAPILTDLKGLPLTAISTGIKEIDAYLNTQWNTNHTSPSLALCSSNTIVSIANKIASAGNNNQVRLELYESRNGFTGGLYLSGYVNKFASSMINMQTTIPFWAHPYMPDGAIEFVSEDIPPETLPYAGVAKSFELDTPIPYTYLPLGRSDRSFPYTIFYNQTLKCYWPSAQGALTGIRVDQ